MAKTHILQLTGPLRLEKQIATLLGILRGAQADGTVSGPEAQALARWYTEGLEFARKQPFAELLPPLADALVNNRLDPEDLHDLTWLCERLNSPTHFGEVEARMQELHAMIATIAADRVITAQEVQGLFAWLEANRELAGRWPFDELESLILGVLKDGFIDKQEHDVLLAFFADFDRRPGHRAIANQVGDGPPSLVRGLCAVCPEIEFEGKCFCFTGDFTKVEREDLFAMIDAKGGRSVNTVSAKVDYLVIGAAGSPNWMYACYGRKVEQAMDLRKETNRPVIVHEIDFLDACN